MVLETAPDEPDDDYKWAIRRFNEYQYRKLFGLSKEQYLEEPMEDYNANSLISSLIADKMEKKSKVK